MKIIPLRYNEQFGGDTTTLYLLGSELTPGEEI